MSDLLHNDRSQASKPKAYVSEMEAQRSAIVLCFLWLFFIHTHAKVYYHEFVVQETPVTRLCRTRNIITVNGQFPGPTLAVRNGDTLVINAVNRAKYNVTVHWHGVRQLRTAWADGTEFVTQCPIRPGGSYTYRFTISDQEGTVWWHAHSSWLRATVYGALIIYPKEGSTYPFSKPHRDVPVLLGGWWNRDPIQVVREAMRTGANPQVSDALTVNGQPGDFYGCSSNGTTVIPMTAGETNLLRFINAAINDQLFVAIAGHTMTVVSTDAAYTKPFTTSVLMIAPGQTIDVLVTANQAPGRYYIAARVYASAVVGPFDKTTTTAILEYMSAGYPKSKGQGPKPLFPTLPAYNDTNTTTAFTSRFKSLGPVKLPSPVEEHLFFTVGLDLFNCPPKRTCDGPYGARLAASMNNISFVLPSTAILQAHYFGVPAMFTTNFPAFPPVQFDYTANNISRSLWQPVLATKLYKLKYGTVVQLVLQGTGIFTAENHPMHLHGYNFYVLAEGFGNFNAATDTAKFNLVDPVVRNTVGVPVNGWVVIRFMADNPGVWFMHCHLDSHNTWGLSMAFLVENGVGELQSLEPPPAHLPQC